MLKRITIKNLLSFRKATTLDFENNTVSCIYGANGTGKSNLFSILDLIKNLVLTNNFSLSPVFRQFQFTDRIQKTSLVQIVFQINKSEYTYHLEFKNNAITFESLFKDKKIVVDSSFDSGIGEILNTEKERFKTYSKKISIFNLMINDEVKIGNSKIMLSVLEFKRTLENIILLNDEEFESEKIIYEFPEIQNRIIDFLNSIDIDITNFEVNKIDAYARYKNLLDKMESNNDPQNERIKNYLSNLKEENYFDYYYNGFIYRNKYKLFERELSDGTLKLIKLLAFIYSNEEKTIIIDEFDHHLHEKLAAKLIIHLKKYCHQVILSSHLIDLFDSKFFDKNELFVMYLGDDLSTNVYRLDRYKSLRSDNRNSFSNMYRNGKLEGYPNYDIEEN